jgi:hypothetical protein
VEVAGLKPVYPKTAQNDAWRVELLGYYETDKPAFILRVADLREERANAALVGGSHWTTFDGHDGPALWLSEDPDGDSLNGLLMPESLPPHLGAKGQLAVFEHITADSNPAFALEGVRRWRGVVERHKPERESPISGQTCANCAPRVRFDRGELIYEQPAWPCPDLRETADEAYAYLTGSAVGGAA